MKHSKIPPTFMARKWILYSFIILLSTSKSESQADLLCISDCETCPVICSPPPSPPSHSPSPPKLPPPPPPSPSVHHYSPPQPYYYFTSPSPSSSPAAHPPPPPPAPGAAAPPPRPSVYLYNPGTTLPSGTGQQNYTYPYYYFYASKASSNFHHQGCVFLTFFIFSRILYEYYIG